MYVPGLGSVLCVRGMWYVLCVGVMFGTNKQQTKLQQLQQLLAKRATEFVGEVMVFNLCDVAKEFLIQHNIKPNLSFYEEMIKNKEEKVQTQVQSVVS